MKKPTKPCSECRNYPKAMAGNINDCHGLDCFQQHYTCLICQKGINTDEGHPSIQGHNFNVCPSCLADARLGRLVRGMSQRQSLSHFGGGRNDTRNGKWAVDTIGAESPEYFMTPEEALEKAGVREVER